MGKATSVWVEESIGGKRARGEHREKIGKEIGQVALNDREFSELDIISIFLVSPIASGRHCVCPLSTVSFPQQFPSVGFHQIGKIWS